MVAERKRISPVPIVNRNGDNRTVYKLTKDCPVCGCPMHIKRKEKGGVHKARKVFWACTNLLSCKHEEREETSTDVEIRIGCRDHEIGLLPEPEED